MNPPVTLANFTQEEMTAFLKEMGQPAFRGKQVFSWVQKGITDFSEMSNVPADLRAQLADSTRLISLTPIKEQKASDGTMKFLFGLPEGDAIETVFMRYHYGNSLCISSQVGCRMGCAFCASTKNGLKRNLTAGEMVEQVLASERLAGDGINHIVVMGIGEPFDNYEEIARFLRITHDENGKNLSYRNITVSTCGLVPELHRFGEEFPQVNVAVSLHAPTDELRRTIMPIANRYALDELMDSVRAHTEKTGRRITFEYALMEGVNDKDEVIEELIRLISGLLCHVNLIPLNRVDESGFVGTKRARVLEIEKKLQNAHIPVTVRRSLGQDIDAACGQLRAQNV